MLFHKVDPAFVIAEDRFYLAIQQSPSLIDFLHPQVESAANHLRGLLEFALAGKNAMITIGVVFPVAGRVVVDISNTMKIKPWHQVEGAFMSICLLPGIHELLELVRKKQKRQGFVRFLSSGLLGRFLFPNPFDHAESLTCWIFEDT